jgi:hypothetical protein
MPPLRRIRIDEISLVDKAANRRKLALYKSENGANMSSDSLVRELLRPRSVPAEARANPPAVVTKGEVVQLLKTAGDGDPAAGVVELLKAAGTSGETVAGVVDLLLLGGVGADAVMDSMSREQAAAYICHSSLHGAANNPFAKAQAAQAEAVAKSAAGEGRAWRELESLVDQRVQKSATAADRVRALEQVIEEHPDLYARHQREVAG